MGLSEILNRGAVRNQETYRQGYDHTEWQFLPRKITPSDIDVVFDNQLRARHLFCEYTRLRLWDEKPWGQKLLYQQLLNTNNYGNACVLCCHNVPPSRDIRSMSDVLSFHVMRNFCQRVECLPIYDGDLWPEFVKAFYGIKNKWGEWWN